MRRWLSISICLLFPVVAVAFGQEAQDLVESTIDVTDLLSSHEINQLNNASMCYKELFVFEENQTPENFSALVKCYDRGASCVFQASAYVESGALEERNTFLYCMNINERYGKKVEFCRDDIDLYLDERSSTQY